MTSVRDDDDEPLTCRICGLRSTNLNSHVTRKHNMSPSTYMMKYPGARTFKFTSEQRRRMSEARRRRGRTTKHGRYMRDRSKRIDEFDGSTLSCRLCDFESHSSLISHIVRRHDMSMSEYRRMFPDDVVQRTAPSTKRKLSSLGRRPENVERLLKNRSFPSEIKHWLRKGYTLDQAEERVRSHQRTLALRQNNPRTREIKRVLTSGDNNPMSLKSIARRYNVDIETARRLTPCYGRTGELHPMYGRHHTSGSLAKISNAHHLRNPTYVSRGEDDLATFCATLGDVKRHVSIGRYNVDILFVGHDVIVEYFGDMWHMNPDVYADDDINPVTRRTAREQWDRDFVKLSYLRARGFRTYVVWERDWCDVSSRKRIEREVCDMMQRTDESGTRGSAR